MSKGYDISDFVRKMDNLTRVYGQIPGRAATIAVNFSKERFRAQNWLDSRTEPWVKRKEGRRLARKNRGRAILVKSGRLKRSIRKIYVGSNRAIIGSDVPYAAVHNYGSEKQSTGTYNIRTRRENTSNRQGIPRRQFMGNSRALAQLIERDMSAQVLKALKS
jgi:phage gpG-like protein